MYLSKYKISWLTLNLFVLMLGVVFLLSCTSKFNSNLVKTTTNQLSLETAPGGTGTSISSETLIDGKALAVYPVLRDINKSYVSDLTNLSWDLSDSTMGAYSTTSGRMVFTPISHKGIVTLSANYLEYSTSVEITVDYTVSTIPDLGFWAKADSLIGTADGTPIETWTDSSQVSGDATQGTESYRPVFKANVVNGNPVLRFDGINSRFDFPGQVFLNTDYTVFAVGARTSGAHENMFLGSTVGASESNLAFGYRQDSGGFLPLTFDLAHYGNDVWSSVAPFATKTFEYWTGWFSQTGGKQINRNGVVFAQSASQTLPLIDIQGTQIGYWPLVNSGYEGDIAEIIVYTRALSDTEMSQVQTYLQQKYDL